MTFSETERRALEALVNLATRRAVATALARNQSFEMARKLVPIELRDVARELGFNREPE